MIECAVCGTTWSEKADMWQDCAPHADVAQAVKVAVDVAAVQALTPVRDPKEPRKGTVIEKEPPAEVKP